MNGNSKLAKQSSSTKVAGTVFLVVLVTQMAIPLVMAANGFKGSFQLGLDYFYLFNINTTTTESSIRFSILPALLSGLIAGLLYAYLERKAGK